MSWPVYLCISDGVILFFRVVVGMFLVQGSPLLILVVYSLLSCPDMLWVFYGL